MVETMKPKKQQLIKWQATVRDKITNMDNFHLFEELLAQSGGDYYDGEFTARGSWEFDQVINEMYVRMSRDGFISQEQYQSFLDKKSKPYEEGFGDYVAVSLDIKKPKLVNRYNVETDPDNAHQYELGWNAAKKL